MTLDAGGTVAADDLATGDRHVIHVDLGARSGCTLVVLAGADGDSSVPPAADAARSGASDLASTGPAAAEPVLDWYLDSHVPESYREAAAANGCAVSDHLTELAFAEQVGAHGLVAVGWRPAMESDHVAGAVDADLSGILVGATTATRPEHVFRALTEAAAFGLRMMAESLRASALTPTEVVLTGEIADSAPLVQLHADVLRLPVTARADLMPGEDTVTAAAESGDLNVPGAVRTPDPASADAYDALYAEFRQLHDHFSRGGTDVMKRLKQIRMEAQQ